MSRKLLLIISLLLCAPAFSESVRACQCIEYDTPICARFSRSDAVFVGRVIDIKPLRKRPDNVYTYVMVRFAVQESFKGVSGREVGVATATTMCDTKFKKGKRYLVYATHHESTNQFFTGMCTGTTLADDMPARFAELRKLRERQVGESISGLLKRVPGITVEVTSKDHTFKTVTNKYGGFSIAVPEPGSYSARISIPYLAQLPYRSTELHFRSKQSESISTFEYDVTVKKGECSYVELEVLGADPRATATVAGYVLTATGEPVDRGPISLINLLDTGRDYVEFLKQDGSFRFEKVVPGEFYLVLNAGKEVPEQFDAPHALTYYPATENKQDAKKIQVAEGAAIENLTMRVGARMSERRVSGTVVWKRGLRVEYPHLFVYSGDEYVRYIVVNDDGKFDFILYGDFAYSVEARATIDETEDGLSQRVKIPTGNSAPLKLVIQRVP